MVKPINPIKREWLKQLRKDQGLNVREIAELFGVSYQHYYDIENGRRNPSAKFGKDLADFYGFPKEKLLKDRTNFKKVEE